MNHWKNWHRHHRAHSIIVIIINNTGWLTTTTILPWKLLPIPKPPLRYCYRAVVVAVEEIRSTPPVVVAVAFLTEEDLFHEGEGVLP